MMSIMIMVSVTMIMMLVFTYFMRNCFGDLENKQIVFKGEHWEYVRLPCEFNNLTYFDHEVTIGILKTDLSNRLYPVSF